MKILPVIVLTVMFLANGCLKKAPIVPTSDVKVGNSDPTITDPSRLYPAIVQFSSFPSTPTGNSGVVSGASCSGTFIADVLLLTAWHCIEDPVTGGVDYNGTKSTKVYLHQPRLWQTGVDSMALDIAVIEFPTPVAPAVMPLGSRKPGPGEFVEVVGYGEAGFADDAFYGGKEKFSDQAKENSAGVKRIGIATVKDGGATLEDSAGKAIPVSEMIVTRPDDGGAYIQSGDSGGGLVQGDSVVGINSHGPADADYNGRYSFFVDVNSPTSQKVLSQLAGRYQTIPNVAKELNQIKSTLDGPVTVNPSPFCRCKKSENHCIVYKDGDDRARGWVTPGNFGRCTQDICNAVAKGDQGRTNLPIELNNKPGLQIRDCNGFATCVNYNCL